MKLTQELINVLQGIHDGKPWQWGDSKDSWIDAIDRNNAIGLMSSGYRIRLKPEPDPYAEAKQAWMDGELQYLSDRDIWQNWSSHHTPSWDNPPSRYRRAPKPASAPPAVKPAPMTIEWTDKEAAAITEIAREQDIPEAAVLRQALRMYQAVHKGAAKIEWVRLLPPMLEEVKP